MTRDTQATSEAPAFPDSTKLADKLALAIEAAPLNDAAAGAAQGAAQPAESYTDLWDRVRAGFQLPQADDPLIAVHERWLANNPEFLARVTERARVYLYYIVDEVEKRGMPLEIALLPAIESAYQPGAYSRAKAMGLWQFIAPTARRYGVKINWWFDGRRDVLSSTRAALDYLQALHDEFDGDWFLALAAYNAGEAGIHRQVDYNRRHGRPADYQHLRLRRETRHYVPKLMAFVRVIADPGVHGVQLAAIPNEPNFAVVDIGSQIDLNVVARLADAPLDVLFSMNPGPNRWATPPDGPHRVLVPVDKKDALILGLSQLPPEARISWRRYHVRRGDSLGAIARRYGVSVREVQRANKLRGTLVRAGRDLLIPMSSRLLDMKLARAGDDHVAQQHAAGRTKVTHHVRAGESLWIIARRYDVSVQDLQHANNLRGTAVRAGRDLTIPGRPAEVKLARADDDDRVAEQRHPAGRTKVTHYVQAGESLWSIARHYGVHVQELAKWNTMSALDPLQVDQTLNIWSPSGVN